MIRFGAAWRCLRAEPGTQSPARETLAASLAYHRRMIVYCCADLIFATKIGSTAASLGVPARPARDAEALDRRLRRVDDGKGNGPVQRVLVDMDLEQSALERIRQVKAFDPSIRVVAFGSHVAVELLEAARRAGADEVMARGSFTAALPGLLRG